MIAEPRRFSLKEVKGRFAICKLAPDDSVPTWATSDGFFSITRTGDELSIVCAESHVPGDVRCERDWQCLRVVGSMAFTEIGVLASLIAPLAAARISVFAISTFDTDYLLVKAKDWTATLVELKHVGHEILSEAAT
jgi:hypothetical protein